MDGYESIKNVNGLLLILDRKIIEKEFKRTTLETIVASDVICKRI